MLSPESHPCSIGHLFTKMFFLRLHSHKSLRYPVVKICWCALIFGCKLCTGFQLNQMLWCSVILEGHFCLQSIGLGIKVCKSKIYFLPADVDQQERSCIVLKETQMYLNNQRTFRNVWSISNVSVTDWIENINWKKTVLREFKILDFLLVS